MADLPWAIHFVAQAPHLDVPRLLAAVLDAQVAPVAAARMVHILQEIAGIVDAARTKVHRQHHFRADAVAPVGEFMNANGIAFRSVPREIQPGRALFTRPDAVFPIVGRNKVATRVADNGHIEVLDQLGHIPTHAVLIGRRVIGLINALIDRPPQMLQKSPIDTIVDCRDRKILMRDDRSLHSFLPLNPYI